MPNVLLVEDEQDLLLVISESLSLHGVCVTTASTGNQALEALKNDGPFDVVVSDIAMPGDTNGIDVARQALEALPGVRVILTSGHPLSHFPPIPKSAQFLSKPYRVKQLVELIGTP